MNIQQLARKNIQTLSPYQSARRIGGQGEIWLNANEYPLDPHLSLDCHSLNRYPDDQPALVVKRYAQYAKVTPQQVIVCRGADESIELLMRAFCEPNQDAIIYCPPTYGMYAVTANTFGIKTKAVPVLPNKQLDLPAITAALDHVKLIYICHPNNPTGNTLDKEDIKQLLKITKNRAIVVVDEAYIEFCPQHSVVNWLNDYPHLAILRTMSKAFALAGIRCGYVLANPDIINLLLKVIAPYPIPTPIAEIAAQALTPLRISAMQKNVALIQQQREQFGNQLTSLSCVDTVFSSQTNFVLTKFSDSNLVFNRLSAKGIVVRDQSHVLQLENCIRITVGTEQECSAVIQILKQC